MKIDDLYERVDLDESGSVDLGNEERIAMPCNQWTEKRTIQ
jgi:hypothetical protein